MPTYEFQCGSCKLEFEQYLPKHDSPKPICPSCNSAEIQRLISRVAEPVFLGTGWTPKHYANKR